MQLVGVSITPAIDFVGEWDPRRRAEVRDAVAQRLDENDPTSRSSDRGKL
jgi:hypothetical protein